MNDRRIVEAESDAPDEGEQDTHWRLMGKLVSFQFKLLMDGVRDLLLSPVSIGVVFYGIVTQKEQPGKYFNRLMEFGGKSDEFINLFGDHETTNSALRGSSELSRDEEPASENGVNFKAKTSDDYVKKLEELILAEYKKGGVISGLKHGTDDLLEKLQMKAEQKAEQKARHKAAGTKDE